MNSFEKWWAEVSVDDCADINGDAVPDAVKQIALQAYKLGWRDGKHETQDEFRREYNL